MSSDVPRTPRVVPLPAGSLAKMAKKYAPFSVRQSFNVGTKNSNGLEVAPDQEVKAMKVFFDNKGVEFRMYGSPEELWDNVQKYIDFQGNNKYFELDPSIHYNHSLKIYPEIRGGREYILKNDIFLYIQNYLLQKDEMLKPRIPLIMLSYFFKSEEKKLGETCEFVIFDKEEFKKFDSELHQIVAEMQKTSKSLTTLKRPAMDFNWKKVFTKFQKLLPVPMNESEMSALAGVLKHLYSCVQNTREQAENVSTLMYTYCSALIPRLQKIIGARPQWFLPKSKLTQKLLASIKPVIRVFEYDDAQYMLAREIENALGPTPIPWKRPEAGFVDVLEWEAGITIWESYGKTMQDADFILVPTTSTKHCFTPIRDGTGLYCKPAAEVLLELLENMFFGSFAFQAPNKRTSEAIVSMFDELEYVCHSDLAEVYFVDHRIIDKIDFEFTKKFQKPTASKVIRDVATKGFTAEDVKAELKHLQLDVYFTGISEYAGLAFQKVLADKKHLALRTCDMYDAVRICLLLSVFKKFPKLAKFLHCHKACHRIHGLNCEDCKKEKLKPKKKQHFMTFFTATEGSPTSNNRPQFDQMIKVDILDKESLNLIVENVPEPVKPAPKPVEKAPKVKKEKEPTTCEKCIRTNERCQKAKDENKECTKRMDDIGAAMDILKYSISDMKKKEAELQKAVEEKYGNRLALGMEELDKLKKKEEQDLERIQTMEMQFSEQEKSMNSSYQKVDLEKMKSDMQESQEQLKNANLALSSENKKKDEMIQGLKEQIEKIQKSKATPLPSKPSSIASTSSSVTSSSTTSSRSAFNPPLIAQMLHDFQKMKEDMGKSDFLRNARTKINRLITLSDDDQVRNTAKYELDRVTREFKATLKKLDENITMIQKNPQTPIAQLHKIQKRPFFSPHFLEEYNRAIAKENQPRELDDTECLICIQNMEPGEATVKCSKCRRRYHTECASDWLSTKTVCPTCDRAMLHPMDYPPLN